MAGSRLFLAPLVAVVVAVFAGYINFGSIYRTLHITGVLRKDECTIATEKLEAIHIQGTPHCEDLHHHVASGLLFTACEGSVEARHSWFPPLTIFDDASKVVEAPGAITVIDPQSMKAKRLQFQGFSGPFVTHGIDVIDDPAAAPGAAVFVFAVNHRPNAAQDPLAPKADSVIELFRHVIGTSTARHIRTIKHDLVQMPNDILALSPTSFLVTNDHFYREGAMRIIEDVYSGAVWSNTIYVEFENGAAKQHETAGVQANVALTGLHNNNGLGRGRTPEEVVLVSAASGEVYFGALERAAGQVTIRIKETFQADSTLDNPFYLVDPYANDTFDASGFVLAGLSRGINLAQHSRLIDAPDGVMVWHLQDRSLRTAGDAESLWEARLLLHDNADYIRTASAAALVPLDPAKNNGQRRAWLFVTGFLSKNMLAVNIGL
ncbi:serum paraoxonase/arylesterase family protein [Cordyceps fumosorosea ARSEF 2679]|uniref:Serum paraoxonase/arylesterase family protein n=1 Tax=Cordyceps fumosorosea (strain ARSEF 2679) TaxID=1081104 RepID=A0A167M2Y6_CORFA|nr:serum paraoxonase/arylesterase family protein [Cordyceps fumosorosea ARSEF 2679]OAA53846.1 serum paraoxonase/arylesterase family protein [Cordyceps fumosorosea ARSEF 2679]